MIDDRSFPLSQDATMTESDDLDLIRRAQGGNVDAIGALYDQHHESIFRYVWLRVGDRALAEDLTGDVFMRMLSALPGYRALGLPFRSWLYRIAHNLIVDHFRRSNSRVSVPLESVEAHADEDDPARAADQTLLAERLQRALARLDETQREVIVLRFFLGLSIHETVHAVGRSEAAVKAIQHRALNALRLSLREEMQVA